MKMLEDRIRKDGIVREGNVLKVDSFINHQMDIPLFREMAKEWKRLETASAKLSPSETSLKFPEYLLLGAFAFFHR